MKLFEDIKLQSCIAVVLTFFGLGLIVAGFVCPPLAEISPSVLTALGEVFTFASACLGIDATYRIKTYRLTKPDGTVEVHHDSETGTEHNPHKHKYNEYGNHKPHVQDDEPFVEEEENN